jgi:hypothetical protein
VVSCKAVGRPKGPQSKRLAPLHISLALDISKRVSAFLHNHLLFDSSSITLGHCTLSVMYFICQERRVQAYISVVSAFCVCTRGRSRWEAMVIPYSEIE